MTYKVYLEARIDYLRGAPKLALEKLQTLSYREPNSTLTSKIINFQRHMEQISGEYLNSARLGDQLLRWEGRSTEQASLRRDIWRDLQHLDNAVLNASSARVGDGQWRAWLDLAALDQPGTDLAQQRAALQQWLENNPNHPAANPLPGGLAYLLSETSAVKKVALLLPLSGRLGPAGRAVLDGYLAGYYAANAGQSRHSGLHEVVILDLQGYDSAVSAYNEAVSAGVELIIGPLSKAAVSSLHQMPNRSVPVLALNRTEDTGTAAAAALVQLSLAPEDEAEQIAELAWGAGARRALILRPYGAWGEKMERALRGRWSALGGEVARSVSYGGQEEYSNSIMSGLNLNASAQRAADVRSMLATNVEFTPRRRADLDVVFLLSPDGSQARSLKPLLAYHYAGGLPVYSTSSVYSGIPNIGDKDLDGIHILEIPWLLGSNPRLRVAIAAGDTGSDNYTRLNALGADAYRVQTRFAQLQAGPNALIRGDVGILTMNKQLQLRRELRPATFDGGELKPL